MTDPEDGRGAVRAAQEWKAKRMKLPGAIWGSLRMYGRRIGAPPTPRFGVSEARMQTPGAENAPRERGGVCACDRETGDGRVRICKKTGKYRDWTSERVSRTRCSA